MIRSLPHAALAAVAVSLVIAVAVSSRAGDKHAKDASKAAASEPSTSASAPTAAADSAALEKRVDAAALDRARKTVQMLDHIYKSAVVLITDHYVDDENDYPAGSAVIELFGQISDKGWHTVELLDASGQPIGEANVADDAFERDAIGRLKSGQDYVEQLVGQGGKPHLRAMTPVPVVMQKCVMCHAHYAEAKAGEPIGAISYNVPVE